MVPAKAPAVPTSTGAAPASAAARRTRAADEAAHAALLGNRAIADILRTGGAAPADVDLAYLLGNQAAQYGRSGSFTRTAKPEPQEDKTADAGQEPASPAQAAQPAAAQPAADQPAPADKQATSLAAQASPVAGADKTPLTPSAQKEAKTAGMPTSPPAPAGAAPVPPVGVGSLPAGGAPSAGPAAKTGVAEMDAWSAEAARAADAIPHPKIDAESKTQPISAKAKSMAGREERHRKELGAGAAKQQPKPPVVEERKPPEDLVPAATAKLTSTFGKKLPDQTVPPLVESPRHTMPVLGSAPVEPHDFRALLKPELIGVVNPDPKKAEEEKARLDKVRAELLAPAKVPDQQAAAKPLTFVDKGPPPPPRFPHALSVEIGDVVVRLLADPEGQAKQILDEIRTPLYRGALKTEFPTMGDEFLPDMTKELDQQLRSIATHAGVAPKDLEARLTKRKEELAAKTQDATTQAHDAGKDAGKGATDQSSQTQAAIAGKKKALDDDAEAKRQKALATAPPPGPEQRRDKYIEWVTTEGAAETTRYRQARELRTRQLNLGEQQQVLAYRLVGQKDELAVLNSGPANTPPSAELKVQSQEAANWARGQETTTHTKFEDLRKASDTIASQNTTAVLMAADEARGDARAWSDKETGTTRGWFKEFLDRMNDWVAQAKAIAAGWAELENGRTAVALAGDLQDIAAIDAAAKKGITEEAMLADQTLTATQRKIIQAYFHGEKANDMIGAVAAGLHMRLTAQHSTDIAQKIEDKLCAITDTGQAVQLDAIAKAQGKAMLPVATSIYAALDHWFHFRMDTGSVFAQLQGLTKIQAASVRLSFRAHHDKSLDDYLEDKLRSDENVRAKAQLAGDQALADAAAFEASIHWYGNDKEGMMAALRQKTPEERDKFIAAYAKQYGEGKADAIRKRIDDQLGGLQKERANALLDLDRDKADAIGLRAYMPMTQQQQESGETPMMLGDRDKVEGIYKTITDEVKAQGDKEGWTSDEIQAEITRRVRSVEGSFDKQFSKDFNTPKGGALRAAFEHNMLPGGSRDLVNALASNDLGAADAARVKIEDEGLWASDKVINARLEDQYLRALEDKRRDEGPELHQRMEAEMQAKLKDDRDRAKKDGKVWNEYDEARKRRQDMEAAFEKKLSDDAQAGAQANMSDLDKKFAGAYGKKLRDLVSSDTSGTTHEKAMKLLDQNGYLTNAQHVYYAVKGLGTDDAELKKAVKGRTWGELQEMRAEYRRDHPGQEMDDDIIDDVSGRDEHDYHGWLAGEPETAREQLDRLKYDLEYERKTGGESYDPNTGKVIKRPEFIDLEQQVAKMEQNVAVLYDPKASDEDKRKAGDRFDQFTEYAQSAVEEHRRVVDAEVEMITMVAAVVVAVAVTALTAGAAGLVMASVLGAVAATATSMLIKKSIKGAAYGWEEFGVDAAVGVVDAAMAGLTAGLGGKLLGQAAHGVETLGVETAERVGRGAIGRAVPTVEWMARFIESDNAVKRNLALLLAHGAEAIVQGTPSAFVGSVLNDQNWEQGDPLSNILKGTIEQAGSSLAFAFALQGGHWAGGKAFGRAVKAFGGGKATIEGGRAPVARPVEFAEHPADFPKWLAAADEAALKRRAESAQLHNSEVPDQTSPARHTELKAMLADPAMRDRIPIVTDSDVAGRGVEVRFKTKFGGVGEVEVHVGPDALPSDVALHLDTVKAVESYGGLSGRVKALLERLRAWQSNNALPPPFTKAWEAGFEVSKLKTLVEMRLKMLEHAEIPPENLPRILDDFADLRRQIAEHEATMNAMDLNPGEGFIAAKGKAKKAKIDRPIPAGGEPIDGPGRNPPADMLSEPDLYFYNTDNKQYMRRPEPPPPFRPDPKPPTGVKVERPIPKGGEPIIGKGKNPPADMARNPDFYYYDPATGKYKARPEPPPAFRLAKGDPRAIPCFPAETLVATDEGPVPIETIRSGVSVLSADQPQGGPVSQKVTAVFENRTTRLVRMVIGHEAIRSTAHHRFWVENRRAWVAAERLEPGYLLRSADGSHLAIDAVSFEDLPELPTYNFTLEEMYTYFVGAARVLVHNLGESGGKIYIGRNPKGQIVYVGLTKDDLLIRQAAHRADAIREPKKYGFKKGITLEVVEGMTGLTDDEMRWHERRIYDELKARGEKLQNPLEETTTYEKLNELYERYC